MHTVEPPATPQDSPQQQEIVARAMCLALTSRDPDMMWGYGLSTGPLPEWRAWTAAADQVLAALRLDATPTGATEEELQVQRAGYVRAEMEMGRLERAETTLFKPAAPADKAAEVEALGLHANCIAQWRQDCAEIERLAARLAQVGWHTIETAPHDKFIFLYCPEDNSRWLAKWQGGRWYGVDDIGLTREGMGPDDVTGWAVTHWQSLPSPPAAGEGGGAGR